MQPAPSAISHYTILGQIGAGGMGVVYKARDSRLDRTVAIKILAPDSSADAGRRARFTLEAKAVSALNHPNVVTIHEIGFENDSDFIVMEFVPGQTLSRVIQSGPLDISKAVSYAHQIADALRASSSSLPWD
jgi:serine/threonine protein kinase